MAAGILTGIGFLGAGAILRHGNNIRGVTTGAVLWYATILGMACGSGRLQLAGLGTPCSGGLGVVACFFFGLHAVYYQSQLNRLWAQKAA